MVRRLRTINTMKKLAKGEGIRVHFNDAKIARLERKIISNLCKREALSFDVPELEEFLWSYFDPEIYDHELFLEAIDELLDGPFSYYDIPFPDAPHLRKMGYKHLLEHCFL